MDVNNSTFQFGGATQFINVMDKESHSSDSDYTEVNNILYSHRAPSASHDAAQRILPPCHPKTRVELLDDIINNWASSNTQIMWLRGFPGFGGSSITQAVAKRFAVGGTLAASFFFSYSSQDRCHTKKFVSTIAYDIFVKVRCVRPAMKEALLDRSLFEKTLEGLWADLVVHPLNLCASQLSTPLFIVVDGLDECVDSREVTKLLKCLLGITRPSLHPGIKIFVSCRPEPFISAVFERAHAYIYECRTDALPTIQDIRVYLTWELEVLCRGQQGKAEGGMIEKLVKKSSGQFLYAKAAIHFISEQNDINPLRTLQAVVERPLESFKVMDQCYLDIINRAIQRGYLDPLLHNLLIHKVADCQYRPQYVHTDLTISDLAAFWFVDCRKVCSVLSELDILLSYTKRIDGTIDPNQPFYFRFRSFIDFLQKPSQDHPLRVTHAGITKVVLQSILVMESQTVPKKLLIRTQQTWMDLCTHCEPDFDLPFKLRSLRALDIYDLGAVSWTELDESFQSFKGWLPTQTFLESSPTSHLDVNEARYRLLMQEKPLHEVASFLKLLYRNQILICRDYTIWMSFICRLRHHYSTHATMQPDVTSQYILEFLTTHSVTDHDPHASTKYTIAGCIRSHILPDAIKIADIESPARLTPLSGPAWGTEYIWTFLREAILCTQSLLKYSPPKYSPPKVDPNRSPSGMVTPTYSYDYDGWAVGNYAYLAEGVLEVEPKFPGYYDYEY
ncbi:hypothetical protein BDN72DRAFT_876092 [Pluteus cervinus]|uniref:Uncharacterized protein n=1 Tax=Pluteus cervinus TaxID=181527 RepID=A0ACD3B5D8_9AGAR|nr:hypothetical protein BDN72DRAFT_876092 [Pluteus cervinus]